MKKFYIEEVTTKDKLVHQGVFYKPSLPHFAKASRDRALLWVHGLTDNFYGDIKILEALALAGEKIGLGVASFNTRGHDVITSITKLDKDSPKGHTSVMMGAGREKFKDCIYDIDAGITFLKSQGFTQIFIAGISTGANKVCYYAGTRKDPGIAGIILVSPISDVAIKINELGDSYAAAIRKAESTVKKGKGELLAEGLDYMPLTPNRFLSLYKENSSEDVFPYYQKNPKFNVLKKITIPMMVILGGADEYSERPVAEVAKIFKKYQKSNNFKSVIIPQGFHGFGGMEKELGTAVLRWILAV